MQVDIDIDQEGDPAIQDQGLQPIITVKASHFDSCISTLSSSFFSFMLPSPIPLPTPVQQLDASAKTGPYKDNS